MGFQAGIQAILIIIAVIVVTTVIRPELDEIQVKQDNLAELNDAINKADTYNRSLAEKLNRANSTPQADLVSLNRFLPNSIDSSRVARDLENIVKGNGLLLQDITISELEAINVDGENASADVTPGVVISGGDALRGEIRRDLVTQVFSVEAIGTYQNMKEMLRAIERNAYPLRLNNMEFVSENEEGSVLFLYKLELQAFALQANQQ